MYTVIRELHRALFGEVHTSLYFHALLVHGPVQHEVVCCRSTNTVNEKRIFKSAESAAKCTDQKPKDMLLSVLKWLQYKWKSKTTPHADFETGKLKNCPFCKETAAINCRHSRAQSSKQILWKRECIHIRHTFKELAISWSRVKVSGGRIRWSFIWWFICDTFFASSSVLDWVKMMCLKLLY